MKPKNLKLFVEGGKKTRFINGNKPWNYGTAKKYVCQTCGKEFKNKSHGKPKYCSSKCKKNGGWGKLIGKWNLGIKFSKERKKQMSKKAKELGLGKNLFIPKIREKAIESARRALIGKPSWNRGGKAPWATGKKNVNWKGGISSINKLERSKFRQTIQKEVFKRDNYQCQICNSNRDLQVDHIQSWAEYVNMRFNINNCRTLCVKCHYKITYGKPMPPSVRAWGHNMKNLKGGNKIFLV